MNEYFNNIFIKKIIDFYVFSNIHVAFATFCLVKITLLNIGVSENMTAWFVFFLLWYLIISSVFYGLKTLKLGIMYGLKITEHYSTLLVLLAR